ncbi:MAG: alpha/beta fold hydrolase [Gemmatimonadales bacterium]
MSGAPLRIRALRVAFRTVGTVAPGVAARWAETLFCTPPHHEVAPADEEFVATGSRFEVQCAGQRLAAWTWGKGPTILLAHGWGSRAGRFRELATTLVDEGFRVVAHDAPAHGRSTGRFATLPEFARAIRAVADHVGDIHGVLGHSLGGAAACIAVRDGLLAPRLVIAASPADVQRYSRDFGDYLRIPLPTRQAMQRNLEARLGARLEDLHIPTFAPGILVPTLVIHDREDGEVPFSHAEALARAFPHARLIPTQGLGHRAVLRDPQVVREVIAFLRDGA